MGTFAPPQLSVGAVRKNLPYGLFSVVEPQMPADPFWQVGGVTWEWFNGVIAGTLGAPVDSGTISGMPKDFVQGSGDPEWDGVATATSFSVYGHFLTSPVAWSQDRAEQRAIEHLLNAEQLQVESLLWTGARGNTPWLGNGAVSLGTVTLRAGVALLEDFIGSTYGSLGVLHMSRKNATELLTDTALETRNGILQTHLGTPVIASSGYASNKVYGSPGMFCYRSEVFTSSQRGTPLLDTRNNDLYAIAERTYLIGYDPTGVGVVTIS